METISDAVGIRNGLTMMPNKEGDLRAITRLLDHITLANGGTAATPGLWNSIRPVLIDQVTAAIIVFQTVNRRPTIDGVVDKDGATLRLMNQLAISGPLTATVVSEDVDSRPWVVANPMSLDGKTKLRAQEISPLISRKLISVEGSSIKWFGVVIPLNLAGGISGRIPHIFFTPSPEQGGYYDGTYGQFTAWNRLWDGYTSYIGSQIAASGAPQILVIPFYKTAQQGSLGSFLTNWKEVVSEVLTTAVMSTDPLYLRNTFEFTEILTSSFSNGIITHQSFNYHGNGVASMTRAIFNLDGWMSDWRPNRGVTYLNATSPSNRNPVGTTWYLSGRFADIRPTFPGWIDHQLCRACLLHGLMNFGR